MSWAPPGQVLVRERIDWREGTTKRSYMHKEWSDGRVEYFEIAFLKPGDNLMEVAEVFTGLFDITREDWDRMAALIDPYDAVENSDWGSGGAL